MGRGDISNRNAVASQRGHFLTLIGRLRNVTGKNAFGFAQKLSVLLTLSPEIISLLTVETWGLTKIHRINKMK
jgi:hypothetical protein